MSIEQAKAFFEKVKNDEELIMKLSKAQDSESKLEIARQEGFDFDEHEAKQVISGLSEVELESITGGQNLVIDEPKQSCDMVTANGPLVPTCG